MTKKVFSKRKERRKKYEDKRWGKTYMGKKRVKEKGRVQGRERRGERGRWIKDGDEIKGERKGRGEAKGGE